MAQQNIDFGSFPDDPDADAIRTGFQKAQENFNELYQLQTSSGVLSINRAKKEKGLTVNPTFGNVIISNDFYQLKVKTQSLGVGLTPGSELDQIIIDSGLSNLWIDLLDNTVINESLIIGNISPGNPNVTIANGNVVATNNITATNFFGNVGNLTTLNVTGNILANNITSNANLAVGNVITANIANISNTVNAANINASNVVSTSNLTVTNTANIATANVTGLLTAGNIISGNANLGNLAQANFVNASSVSAGNVRTDNLLYANGLPWDLQYPAGGAGQIQYNDGSNNFAASPNLIFNAANSNLNVIGNVNATYFVGDGGGLSNLSIGNITEIENGSSNIRVYPNSNVTISVNAQPNVVQFGQLQTTFDTDILANGHVGYIDEIYLNVELTTPNLHVTGGIANLGYANKVQIFGGASGQVLTTDGTGNLTWGIGGIGATGATGPQGATGIGATGATGPQGATGLGATGATGVSGATGVPGATGDRYFTTSNTSLTIATGPATLTVGIGLAYATGQEISIAHSLAQRMFATVAAYNSATGVMIVSVSSVVGTLGNVYSSWQVNLAGAAGIPGSTGATGATGVAGLVEGPTQPVDTTVLWYDTSTPGIEGIGATGATGPAGPAGGPTGPQGATGATGPALSNATTIDITNTNGLTTTYYPTFVENRTTNQILRGDVDLTYRTDTNTLTTENISLSGNYLRSVATGISAAGSTQGTATAITKDINIVSTVSAGQGIVLPTAIAGMVIIVNNTSATSLNVYPATGATINTLSTNTAYTHVAGASLQYFAVSATQWYTVGASYA